MKRGWDGNGVWNIGAAPNNWYAAGVFNSTDCETADIGSCYYSANEANGTWKAYPLDPLKIMEMIRSYFTNNGFLIRSETEVDDRYQHDSVESATAGNRPTLVIEHTPRTLGIMIIFLEKCRQKMIRDLLAQGAVPMGRRELVPI